MFVQAYICISIVYIYTYTYGCNIFLNMGVICRAQGRRHPDGLGWVCLELTSLDGSCSMGFHQDFMGSYGI